MSTIVFVQPDSNLRGLVVSVARPTEDKTSEGIRVWIEAYYVIEDRPENWSFLHPAQGFAGVTSTSYGPWRIPRMQRSLEVC